MNKRLLRVTVAVALMAPVLGAGVDSGAGAVTRTTKKTTRTTAPTATTSAARPAPATTKPAAAAEPVSTPAAVTDADTNASMTIGVLATPRNLDPHKTPNFAEVDWLYPQFDRLTTIDDSYEVKPMLATSWSFSADRKQLEFRLRRDATFQDGSPINAAAVKANLDRAINDKDSVVAGALTAVDAVQVVDDSTVRLVLKAPGGALPVTLAGPAGMMINPKAFGRDLSNGPGEGMGSGPYRVTSFKPGEQATFERANFKYWDPSAGLLKNLTIRFSGTSTNGLNGVKAGDYDLAQISGTAVVDALADVQARRIRGTEQLTRVSNNVFMLRSENNSGPMGNKLIRQAIGFAINRNEIVGGLFNGLGKPSTSYYWPEHWAYSAKAASFYTYNQQRARKLIEESGFNRPAIKLTYGQGSTMDPVSQVVAQQLRDVGFVVTLDPVLPTQVLARWQQGQTDMLAASVSGTTYVDPANYLAAYFLPNATASYQVSSDADGFFQKVVNAAGDPTLSPAQRAALYEPALVKIVEEGLMISVNNQLQLWAKPTTKNVEDKVFLRWSGLPDFRSVYVRK